MLETAVEPWRSVLGDERPSSQRCRTPTSRSLIRRPGRRTSRTLNQVLEDRQLSQADAAKVLGVTQPKVSALRHYKLAGFSVERLMNLLTALDRDVEIVIRGSLGRARPAGSASSRRSALTETALAHSAFQSSACSVLSPSLLTCLHHFVQVRRWPNLDRSKSILKAWKL